MKIHTFFNCCSELKIGDAKEELLALAISRKKTPQKINYR
jgi:hypothetical protein